MHHREVGTLSFRGSSLSTLEQCPRKFAADYLVDKKLADEFGFRLRDLLPQVGSVIGSAVHHGHAHFMRELAATGSHGGETRVRVAIDGASEKLLEMTSDGLVGDDTTPNITAARETVGKMLVRVHHDHRPESEPILVERSIQAQLHYFDDGRDHSVEVTGTPDTYLVEKTLPDLKTGRNVPQAYAQMGIYFAIAEAHGYTPDKLIVLWVKRVRLASRQPPAETIPIVIKEAKSHALGLVKIANGGMRKMLKTGEPSVFAANPGCYLCDPRYCRAYGTSFCRIGALVHGK